jgi:L-rhamnose isomerase
MTKVDKARVEKAYLLAQESYREIGVDVQSSKRILDTIPISIQCWQGDDVLGFETKKDALSGGGIQATGNYPGRARTPEELRADLDKALSLIPGKHRLNLHAIYAETGGKSVERDKLRPEHFQNWVDWAKARNMGMDFNPTFFAHPMADTGFTLSSNEEKIRRFWIKHALACRKIAEHMGKALGSPCIMNLWIPDGFKDIPVDRLAPRQRLKKSLDEIFKEKMDPSYIKESLESKLFGIGSESCVIGSHEFYLGYAVANKKMICFDTGHFHPTESVSDKISSTIEFVDEILLHVSRPVRWDSDHIVILDDELRSLCQAVVRGALLHAVHFGMDFFDASVNRVGAWVIGARNLQKALLFALLEPTDLLMALENKGDYTASLARLEELKTMPFEAVWDHYCLEHKVPVGIDWLDELKAYEKAVQSKRR